MRPPRKTDVRRNHDVGVRRREEQRQILARHLAKRRDAMGTVRIKIANMNGTFPLCSGVRGLRALAEKHHVPLRRVMHEAVQEYLRQNGRAEGVKQFFAGASVIANNFSWRSGVDGPVSRL